MQMSYLGPHVHRSHTPTRPSSRLLIKGFHHPRIGARAKNMNCPAITGNSRISGCSTAELEGDPARTINKNLELLFVSPFVECISQFFVYSKVRESCDNFRKAVVDRDPGWSATKWVTHPDLPDQRRAAESRTFAGEIDLQLVWA